MSISATQLSAHLHKKGLPALTLLYGEEPQLLQEALDAIRQQALKADFSERKRLDVGHSAADWQELLNEVETPSLFAPRSLIEVHGEQKSLDKQAAAHVQKIAGLHLDNVRIVLYFPRLEKVSQAAWYKHLAKQDFLEVRGYALSEEEFAAQIEQRLHRSQLHLDAAAKALFIDFHEGNLAAAQQSIARLCHSPAREGLLEEADIARLLDDFSHFGVNAFRESLLGGDWLGAYRSAEKIAQSSKNEITLLVWQLARDANVLLELHHAPQSKEEIFKRARLFYPRQQAALRQAAQHFPISLVLSLNQLAAKLDRINKGVERGDAWLTLRQYCLLRQRR